MKYLYFGTICNEKTYMKMRDGFKVKPSVAPFVFETALLKGFKENQVDLEIRSFPVIPAFPKSRYLGWKGKEIKLELGYEGQWIGAINISGIKQLTQRISSYITLKKWLRENNNEDKAVIIYSAYQPVSKSIVKLCKKYNTKCYAIIPDLPRDMYSVARTKPIKKLFSKIYVHAAIKTQGRFDGYIYLTEQMKNVVNLHAPYIVVEGIADATEARKLNLEDKSHVKAIMYAGSLNARHGLQNLIEAFNEANIGETELWLFGGGDFQEEIERYAQLNPKIRFWGRVSREEILNYERKASLLVNVRNSNDDFTKYSFPSKVIEYMLSGTPLFMTKLPGIPKEYYRYSYWAEDNDVKTLKQQFELIFSKEQEELLAFGAKAQSFIANHKNGVIQAKRIIEFIKKDQT